MGLSNAEIRAKQELINNWLADNEHGGDKLLRNGKVPDMYREEFQREMEKLAEILSNEELEFIQLTSFNAWFDKHPEKVAGEAVESTSIYFPVQIKGNKNDVLETINRTLKKGSNNEREKAKKRKKASAQKQRLRLLELKN